jgi:hypothetical protein
MRDIAADDAASCISTGALELAAAYMTRDAMKRRAPFSDHVIFIDNEVAKFAINAGSSASLGMREPLRAVFDGHAYLAVRVNTHANQWADDLSRGRAADVRAQQ